MLEQAELITKTRQGKEQMVSLFPAALHSAARYLQNLDKIWEERLTSLDKHLKKIKRKGQ